MVGRALYEAREAVGGVEDIGVVEATLIARAVASAPRVAFGVWEDCVHGCRCPIGATYPGEDVGRLQDRSEYVELAGLFDSAAKRYIYQQFDAGVLSGVLEVR